MDEQILAELRAIFRDEVADRLEGMEAQRAVIVSESTSSEDVEAAIDELYRAAHTLKGAAQAVGEAELVRSCHALEDMLSEARGSSTFDRATLETPLDQTLRLLRAQTETETEAPLGPTPPDPPEPVVPRTEARTTTVVAVGPPTEIPEPNERAERPAEPESEPAQAGVGPTGPATSLPSSGTMRVELASVKLLARALQELSTTLGITNDDLEEREIASVTTSLARTLQALRSSANREVQLETMQGPLTQAIESVGVLRRTLALRRLEQGNARASAQRLLQQIDEVMRRLRLTTGRSLRLTLEQATREAARELGKMVAFECTGEDISVDREVLERVREPLSHLVRNAVDHGIEGPQQRRELGKPDKALVRLSIHADGSEVVFILSDDGAGFDFEALARAARETDPEALPSRSPIHYAFAPGVSTRDEATTTSGRGMGLAIVRESVAALHGSVDVQTGQGRGSAIELRVPIHLNAVSGLVVVIDDTEFIIPATTIDRIVRPSPDDIRVVEGTTWLCEPSGTLLPAVLLPVGTGKTPVPRERTTCVVLGRGRGRLALWVDQARDMRTVLIRPLHPRATGSPCVRAATIQPDGSVGLVLDVASVLRRGRPAPVGSDRPTSDFAPATILVVDDSITTRQLVRVVLESAGYEVLLAEDGEIAWRTLRREETIDLVVSDVDMPHLDGLGLLARVRATAALRELPVILVTALEHDEDRRRALDMGADAYLGKTSFDQSSLLERIRDLLA